MIPVAAIEKRESDYGPSTEPTRWSGSGSGSGIRISRSSVPCPAWQGVMGAEQHPRDITTQSKFVRPPRGSQRREHIPVGRKIPMRMMANVPRLTYCESKASRPPTVRAWKKHYRRAGDGQRKTLRAEASYCFHEARVFLHDKIKVRTR